MDTSNVTRVRWAHADPADAPLRRCSVRPDTAGSPADHPSKPELRLRVAEEGKVFGYTITHPEAVRTAWIEVLERPVLLDRKEVKEWDWDRTALGYPPQENDELSISIWDPQGETTTCSPEGVMSTSRDGGLVSYRTIGSRGKFGARALNLDPFFLRVAQDAPEVNLAVTGSDLALGTKFQVSAQEGAKCDSSSLRTQILDLAHARMNSVGRLLSQAWPYLHHAGGHGKLRREHVYPGRQCNQPGSSFGLSEI